MRSLALRDVVRIKEIMIFKLGNRMQCRCQMILYTAPKKPLDFAWEKIMFLIQPEGKSICILIGKFGSESSTLENTQVWINNWKNQTAHQILSCEVNQMLNVLMKLCQFCLYSIIINLKYNICISPIWIFQGKRKREKEWERKK